MGPHNAAVCTFGAKIPFRHRLHQAEEFGAAQHGGCICWERGGSRAAQSMPGGSRVNLSRGRIDGIHCHSFQSRGVQRQLLKPGGQGQGAWVGRLSELMEVSEDTIDETTEGRGE
eukprot:1141041-Pelagomonas_calceolata.AAC.8